MSEQPVHPEAGTEQPITDERSAVEAIATRLEPEEAPQEAQEPTTDDHLTQEDQPAETEVVEGDGEASPQPEEPESAVELPGTLSDLIAAIDVDPDQFMGIKTTVTVDGKPEEVSLSDAIAGYRREADYTQKTQALALQRQEFEQQQQRVNAEFQQKSQHVDGMIQALQEELQNGPSEDDLAYLVNENPAEYIRQTNALKARQQRLQQFMQQRGQMFQQEQQAMQQQIGEYRKTQQEALRAKVPGIDNPEKGNAVQKEVIGTLGQYGFTPEEVQQYMAGPFDHRLIVMALELNALKQEKAKGKEAVKKIALKPKVTPPGTGRTAKTEDEQTQELRNRLRRQGRDRTRRKGASDDLAMQYVKSKL